MTNLKAVLSIFSLVTVAPSLVSAAEITEESWRGHQVLRLSGLIQVGDLARVEDALASIEPLPHGLPVMLLDSPGGSVEEALRISELFKRLPVHAVVPDGARCASSCASLIFVGAPLRTVEHFGYLGQHSCSQNGEPDPECNEILAQHAIEHGVSHGSVAAFATYVPPDDILWFSRILADGWGLTRYPGSESSGFQKSEPQAIIALGGSEPPAQSAWRLDFRGSGYEAFLRPVRDDLRELQLNIWCDELLPGKLFVSIETNGLAEEIAPVVVEAIGETDLFSWKDDAPIVRQMDAEATEVIIEIPSGRIFDFLTKANEFEFSVNLRPPYEPMGGRTYLSNSRKNLLFASNHCINQ